MAPSFRNVTVLSAARMTNDARCSIQPPLSDDRRRPYWTLVQYGPEVPWRDGTAPGGLPCAGEAIFGRRFVSTHLRSYDSGEDTPAFHLQNGFGIETSEQIEQGRDETCPSRLMAGTNACAIVTVEVFVKKDQVAPVRIFLK